MSWFPHRILLDVLFFSGLQLRSQAVLCCPCANPHTSAVCWAGGQHSPPSRSQTYTPGSPSWACAGGKGRCTWPLQDGHMGKQNVVCLSFKAMACVPRICHLNVQKRSCPKELWVPNQFFMALFFQIFYWEKNLKKTIELDFFDWTNSAENKKGVYKSNYKFYYSYFSSMSRFLTLCLATLWIVSCHSQTCCSQTYAVITLELKLCHILLLI